MTQPQPESTSTDACGCSRLLRRNLANAYLGESMEDTLV
jgi:hypothetical protein